MVEPDTHSHLDCDVSPGEETRIIVITSTLPFNYFVSTDNLQEKSETPENLVISERADHVAINFARNVPSKYQVIFVGKLIHENSNFASQDKKDLLKNMMERQKSCLVVGHVGPDKEQSFGRSRLWPLFHNVLWESSLDQNTRLSEWLKYESENLAFSDVVRKHWRPNDIVVIFDFALLLLPAMLRAHCESTSIGLYLRTPFPSSELFRCLPEAKKILSGALGANVIGLQTHGYVRHLISSCTRLLGLESTPKRVDFNGTPVDIVAQPIGIDPGVIRANLKSEAVWKRIEILGEKYMPMGYHSMRDKHLVRDMNVDMQRVAADEKLNFDTEGTRLILGMESVDQCNGILHKLATLNNLFQRYPEWIGRIKLVQIIFPLDMPYESVLDGLEGKVSEAASLINNQYGTLEYQPVQVSWQSMSVEDYVALLSLSHCLLITSERDSINTAILDYVICQTEAFELVSSPHQSKVSRWGVPVISEFLGLSSFMPASFQINPFDYDSTADSIVKALKMDEREKKINSKCIARFANANTQRHWAQSFLSIIEHHEVSRNQTNSSENYGLTQHLNPKLIFEAYDSVDGPRLILLDYDGTISPIKMTPSAAVPSVRTIESLRMLAADSRNLVYVISGRDQTTLTTWLGSIHGLTLVAEHGTFIRINGSTDWQPTNPIVDESGALLTNGNEEYVWHGDVLNVMEYYTERTPGSMIERKCASIVWHYRQADISFGEWQAKELQTHLEETVASTHPVDILAGKKNIEVRPSSSNKGAFVRKILGGLQKMPSFLLCAGDDRTDEDMFRVLDDYILENSPSQDASWCYTCIVGNASRRTNARYRVQSSEHLVTVLSQLAIS